MLYALYERLREMEEHLTKLRTCLSQLHNCQDDFKSSQKMISEPVLTASNWNGTLAQKFTELRENGMVKEYSRLADEKLSEVISEVEAKITELKTEIESIKLQIASLEAQERLNASKRM